MSEKARRETAARQAMCVNRRRVRTFGLDEGRPGPLQNPTLDEIMMSRRISRARQLPFAGSSARSRRGPGQDPDNHPLRGAGGVVALFAFFAAIAGGCSSDDGDRPCSSEFDCREGETCGTATCSGFLKCIPSNCACTSASILIPGDECLHPSPPSPPVTCSCAQATCAKPFDSCGRELCPGVCKLGQACSVCLQQSCAGVELCKDSYCMFNYSLTEAVCRPSECFAALRPPLCGTPDAPCGEECCEPECVYRECGREEVCGLSCGVCAPGMVCNSSQRCEPSTGISRCEGDLRVTEPWVAVESATGDQPASLGGTIADGSYDLVAIRAYDTVASDVIFGRAALRFSASGTKLEQIYDANPDYGADAYSPHRLFDIEVDGTGTVLHFVLTCPDPESTPQRRYNRGFTVQGSELWLSGVGYVEIYRQRQ